MPIARDQTKEPKDILSAENFGRNFGRKTFGFPTVFRYIWRKIFCLKEGCFCNILCPSTTHMLTKSLQKETLFGRNTLFWQKDALSAEYRFRHKFIFQNPLLSAIGRKRKILFRLITTNCHTPSLLNIILSVTSENTVLSQFPVGFPTKYGF